MEMSQPITQPASFVAPQPNQHSTHVTVQPGSQSSNYTPQSTQLTNMSQGAPYICQLPAQVPVQGQSVTGIQHESEELENDQQLQHTGAGMFYMFYSQHTGKPQYDIAVTGF